MGFVIIPDNYNDLPNNLAPICLEDRDSSGNRIDPDLIDDGVRPIHGALCRLTTTVLRDVCMVSEVVDNAVQSVWRRHGGVAGSEARQRVYARATWEAKRLRNDWRKQRGREGSLDDKKYMETVDTIARALLFDAEGALKDPRDYECMYEAHLDTDVFADFVQHPELRRILRLYMHGFTWTEIAAHVGRKPDAIRQSLFRAVRQFRWQRLLST